MRTSLYSQAERLEHWLAKVDQWCILLSGLSYQDLPDVCYADWHDEGMSPKSAARKAIRMADGGDE